MSNQFPNISWVEKDNEITISIKMEDELITKLATNSLLGIILTFLGTPSFEKLKTIILMFPKSSLDFCKKNGGPRELIVLEYNIPCILEDILWFIENKKIVKIEYYNC